MEREKVFSSVVIGKKNGDAGLNVLTETASDSVSCVVQARALL